MVTESSIGDHVQINPWPKLALRTNMLKVLFSWWLSGDELYVESSSENVTNPVFPPSCLCVPES